MHDRERRVARLRDVVDAENIRIQRLEPFAQFECLRRLEVGRERGAAGNGRGEEGQGGGDLVRGHVDGLNESTEVSEP